MYLHRALAFSVLAAASSTWLAAQTASPPPAAQIAVAEPIAARARVEFTPEAMETFLLKARIADARDAGKGVTGSRRATLSDGIITHDAHIQFVDIARPIFEAGGKTELNFKDSYRFNVAGYRLARLVGLDNVPMSVERQVNGKPASVTWWLDDVLMDEQDRMKKKIQAPDSQRMVRQQFVMRVWDELVQNKDRNQTNIVYTNDWKMWLIDHSRAFRLDKKLQKPDQLLRCDRSLLEGLRNLTQEVAAVATKGSLQGDELTAVMARRDALVKHFEALIAMKGEAAVLFTH